MKRVFIISDDALEFEAASRTLKAEGFEIANHHGCEFRVNIGLLSTADDVCILPDWWSYKDGVCLQTIAAWMRLGHVSPTGVRLETKSLRG